MHTNMRAKRHLSAQSKQHAVARRHQRKEWRDDIEAVVRYSGSDPSAPQALVNDLTGPVPSIQAATLARHLRRRYPVSIERMTAPPARTPACPPPRCLLFASQTKHVPPRCAATSVDDSQNTLCFSIVR